MPFRKCSFSDLLLTCFFLALFCLQLSHHQLWRDELNVYGIAAASPSFRSLLWHVNHEGHPVVWYVIIWLAIQLIHSVLVLKVVQGLVGAGIILMIGLVSPFTRGERILLLLSYFILFEYTVLSRMYGICLLLALVFLWRRIQRPDSFLLNALLLGVMANTDILGLLFSGAFGLEYALNRFRERPDKAAVAPQLAGAGLLYLTMVACCYITIRPPADISWRTTGHILRYGFQATHLASVAIENLVLPWFPIGFASTVHPGHHWNPLSMDHPAFYAALSIPVLSAYALTFRRDRDLLAAFLLASLGGVAFSYFIFSGNVRNWGITFVAFVAALWLQRFRRPDVPSAGLVLLTLSAISGVAFSIMTWTRPFSNAEATANWLKAHHFQNASIVGTPDATVAGLAVLMRRPIYFLDCRCSDDYLLFSNRRDDYDVNDMAEYAVQAFDKLNSPKLVLLLGAPLTAKQKEEIEQRGGTVQALASFTGAEAPEEDFFVYAVSRKLRQV